MFLLSEKAEWQKKKETFTDVQNKLEEQKQVDAVKIQQFNVSRTNKCAKCNLRKDCSLYMSSMHGDSSGTEMVH